MAKVDLSIIIVNHNTQDLLLTLLNSLKLSEVGSYRLETIVVDNASNDKSRELLKQSYPQVKLIVNSQNLGFAMANNQGLRQAQGRYLLLLNSDTVVEKETIRTMIEFMDSHSEFGVATCRVELSNGQLDPACHRGFPTVWVAVSYFVGLEKLFPKSKLFSQYHQGWKKKDIIHEVEVISGAFFMLRREVIEKVGLLDEGFFMYGEDVDWCMRIHQAGFRIAFVPVTKITHVKGQSARFKKESNKVDHKQLKNHINKHFWQTMKLFYQKHYSHSYPRFLKWLIFRIIDWKIKRRQ